MTHRYLYADKAAAGAGAGDPPGGLFATADELAEEQAARRYGADPQQRDRWFGIVWYSYPPDQRRFLRRNESVGLVRMSFQPDGIGTEEVVTKRGGGQPDEVELQEFSGVDVSANWFDIPEFGDWEAFFEPEGDDAG